MGIQYNEPGVPYNSASYTYDGTSLSNDKFGTVSGSSTTSGSAVGRKGAFGVVNGSSTTSGSAVGREGSRGTVSGSSTTSGSAVGRKGAFGVVNGSSTTSGSAIGTGGDITAPTTPAGGGPDDFVPPRRDRNLRRPRAPQREHRRGRVSGVSTTSGFAHGTGRNVDSEDELVLLALI